MLNLFNFKEKSKSSVNVSQQKNTEKKTTKHFPSPVRE